MFLEGLHLNYLNSALIPKMDPMERMFLHLLNFHFHLQTPLTLSKQSQGGTSSEEGHHHRRVICIVDEVIPYEKVSRFGPYELPRELHSELLSS